MNALVWIGIGNLILAVPLAIAAWLVGRCLRRPAITHGLWVLVLLKLVTPPLGIVPVPLIPEPARVADSPIAEATRPQLVAAAIEPAVDDVDEGFEGAIEAPFAAPAANLDLAPHAPQFPDAISAKVLGEAIFIAALLVTTGPWVIPVLGGLWLAGAAIVWSRALIKATEFQNLISQTCDATPAIRERVERLAEAMSVSSPRVVFVLGTLSPMLWVWGRRATLVLPRDFFERLDVDMQTTLLVHELAHWRRGDHWVRRLECLALGLYWWCPLAWWAQAGVRQAEEELCDAWVVATLPDSARTYALALVETVDFLAGASASLPPLASGLGPFPSLQRRLTMIFRSGAPRRLTALGLFGLMGLGGLFLTWSPAPMAAYAQDEERPRKKKEGAPREGGPREGAPREGEPKAEPKRGGEGPDDLNRLREELNARKAELERMQAELQRKARELQMLMDKARAASPDGRPEGRPESRPEGKRPIGRPDGQKDPGRPGDGPKDPNRVPDGNRPEGGPRDGGPREGGDVNRRLDEMERKLEMMIREFGAMRREIANPNRGPGGPGGPPNPPIPPRDGKNKGARFEFEIELNRKGPNPEPRPGARFAPSPEAILVAPVRVDAR